MKVVERFLKSSISGSILVASGAIGAGMFSLPLISAPISVLGIAIAILVVWAITLSVTTLLARVNLTFVPGTSFDTIVTTVLGRRWSLLNNIGVWFIFSILLYAYFTAGGGIVQQSLTNTDMFGSVPRGLSSLLFGLVIAMLVWSGSRWVSIVCGILLFAMVVNFVAVTGGLLAAIDTSLLKNSDNAQFYKLGSALPYFVTAFACGGLVPSLVKHYEGSAKPVLRSVTVGLFVTLLIYAAWLLVTLGSITRIELSIIANNGGGVVELAEALKSHSSLNNLPLLLTSFSHLAITTSFLSIALGLFDFVSDLLEFDSSLGGRTKAALCAFSIPAALSFFISLWLRCCYWLRGLSGIV